jgi:hypothetical protein
VLFSYCLSFNPKTHHKINPMIGTNTKIRIQLVFHASAFFALITPTSAMIHNNKYTKNTSIKNTAPNPPKFTIVLLTSGACALIGIISSAIASPQPTVPKFTLPIICPATILNTIMTPNAIKTYNKVLFTIFCPNKYRSFKGSAPFWIPLTRTDKI